MSYSSFAVLRSNGGVCNLVSESTVESSWAGTLAGMDSERLKLAQQAVMAASRRVGSQERSSAFLAHSRVMVAL